MNSFSIYTDELSKQVYPLLYCWYFCKGHLKGISPSTGHMGDMASYFFPNIHVDYNTVLI